MSAKEQAVRVVPLGVVKPTPYLAVLTCGRRLARK
jgi:hypothetical protein